MASTGAFVAGSNQVIKFLKYNMRSQMFAKSLQMQLVVGAIKRLEILRNEPVHKQKLWDNVKMLQTGLKERGFDIGKTQSCVTPVFLNVSTTSHISFLSSTSTPAVGSSKNNIFGS